MHDYAEREAVRSASGFLLERGNGLNGTDGTTALYRIGIRLGNVSSSPFRAIELREHRASSAPSLRKPDGASAGKLYSFVPAFNVLLPPPRGARGFPFLSAVIHLHRLGLKGTITSPNIGGQMQRERKKEDYARHRNENSLEN